MFRMTWNMTSLGTASVSHLVETLRTQLPVTWSIEPGTREGADFSLLLRAPDGSQSTITGLIKRSLEARDVEAVLRQARSLGADAVLVLAPYLSPRTRERIVELGANYADTTGNLRLVLDRPAVFLQTQGADKDPAPQNRALASLKGPAAGRVVRALCDLRPPYGVRELAERTGTPLASVARVLALLDREALVQRSSGAVVEVDWQKLIARWTQDYSMTKSNQTSTWLAPRGLPALLDRLSSGDVRYAVTSSMAASHLAPVAPPRLCAIYVENQEVAAGLDLTPAEAGVNVLLLEPYDDVVFQRTVLRKNIVLACPSQVAADLLTSPGRGPAEAEALLTWMQAHEEEWRG